MDSSRHVTVRVDAASEWHACQQERVEMMINTQCARYNPLFTIVTSLATRPYVFLWHLMKLLFLYTRPLNA